MTADLVITVVEVLVALTLVSAVTIVALCLVSIWRMTRRIKTDPELN